MQWFAIINNLKKPKYCDKNVEKEYRINVIQENIMTDDFLMI